MGKGSDKSIKGRPSLAFLFLFYVSVALLLGWQHVHLPEPKGFKSPRGEFSEARVRKNLDSLFDVGVRVLGSDSNEEFAREMILKEVEKVKAATQPGGAHVDVDVQVISGSFELEFLTKFTNAYANVTNILVLVHGADQGIDTLEDRSAVLLSSHYDAALGAGAASDAAVHICEMLEILRIVATSPTPPPQPILFNFNGAEESILQASHGFITAHSWSRLVRAFINLEAAGAGGRELLFQSGANELTEAYVKGAPYPHGSVLAQDVFASGIIPGETDYRIYRDFGALPGLDIANVANGYVYHTHLDRPSMIQPGSIQRCGENVLETLKQLQSHDAAPTPEGNKEDTVVYFDVLGLWMLSYSHSFGVAINGAVAIMAMVYLAETPAGFKATAKEIWGAVFAAVATVATPVLLAFVMMQLGASMFWYSRPYLAVLVFGSAALSAGLFAYPAHTSMLVDVREARFAATQLFWVALLAVLTFNGLGSAYLPALWVGGPLLAQIATRMTTLPAQRARAFGLFCLGQLPPLVLSGQLAVIVVTFFLPLLGRAGTSVPGDIVLAAIFGVLAVLLLSYVPVALPLFGSGGVRLLRRFTVACTLGFAIISVITSKPYGYHTPKRLYIQSVERIWKDGSGHASDSGVWLNAFDHLGLEPVRAAVGELMDNELAPHCPEGHTAYCDYPWFLPLKDMLPMGLGSYVAGPSPNADGHLFTWLELLGEERDEEKGWRTLHLRMVGPDHMTLYLDGPTPVLDWSLDAALPDPGEDHFVFFASGSDADWRVSLSIPLDAPPFVVAMGSHYINETSTQLDEIHDALPGYMTNTGFTSLWVKHRF